jgi:small conductance mechanosensitive channel
MTDQLETLQHFYEVVIDFAVTYSFQLFGGLLTLAAGFLVAGWVSRALLRIQAARNVDKTLAGFIASTIRMMVVGMFIIVALSRIGISITPLIAAIGGLAVGASFAMQGPMSNYGAGLVIILTRMYKVGDTITVVGHSGVVTEITLALTRLIAEDGEDIVIPNKQIAGEVHINSHANRVVEGSVGVSYGDDPVRAIEVIRNVLAADADVTAAPAPAIGIERFDDSSVAIAYRYWVPSKAFFITQYRVNLAVFQALADAGLTIPYPQRDVHVTQAAALT